MIVNDKFGNMLILGNWMKGLEKLWADLSLECVLLKST